MSQIKFDKIAQPSPPSGGVVTAFIDENGSMKTIDSDGNVTDLSQASTTSAYTDYLPQASTTFKEGRTFYDNDSDSLAVHTDIEGHPIHLGTDAVIRVINKTGLYIPAGRAIRNTGIDIASGQIKAGLAQANSLTTSFVIGVTYKGIAIDEEGWVINQGHVKGIDTSLLAVGGSIFLSDLSAGGIIQSIPDVASALGTVIVSDPLNGELFIKIDNLITYPQVTGYLRGQNAPSYSLTTTVQDIVNYELSKDIIMTVDPTLGTMTVPLNGIYHISFTAVLSFISATSTRTAYFELYNETTATIEGAFPMNIPRDSTEDGVSFTAPFSAISGHVYKMRVRSSVAITVNIDNVALMMTSNHLGS